jgi:hypothetical protein
MDSYISDAVCNEALRFSKFVAIARSAVATSPAALAHFSLYASPAFSKHIVAISNCPSLNNYKKLTFLRWNNNSELVCINPLLEKKKRHINFMKIKGPKTYLGSP